MACVKNTMALIESAVGKVNPYYDMCTRNIIDIANNSKGWAEMISNAFRFGYVQGIKAANSEIKKK